ncbi:unnamed protein product [Darwinula stevensoni]|uniref:EF-hand domain-containing protein n=1 Tax=Darwinula stevensoni TaxID=69355 RepID=A0A7R9ABE5_9CRUS|nr:unnamed protein product [Darwinula stevensoni]CAG0898980.1 unnamed protein product [Darwinula stevensoni]
MIFLLRDDECGHRTDTQENPFRRRICEVFSSSGDGSMSFEDFLDLASTLSGSAPRDIKVAIAFRIFDYNSDGYLCPEDLTKALNQLSNNGLTAPEITIVIEKVLEESDIDDDGKLSFMDFQHIIERAPDFMANFHFRI